LLGLQKHQLGSRHFSDDKEVEMEARKWLRQQSKDFRAADFDAVVKCDGAGVSMLVGDILRNTCFL
jgi:hypothetical protein